MGNNRSQDFTQHLSDDLPDLWRRQRLDGICCFANGLWKGDSPQPEQRRIAAVLNAIQDAIAAQEDVIAAARAFKRSLMQRLFTYGPGREPAPTKETEIGEIPAHFELKHPYTFSSFILRFRPTNHVSSRYLTWFFRFMHASGFFSFRRDQSSVNSVINASSAAELPVAFPFSSFEQAAIVEQIEAANAKIAAEEDRKTALAALFKSMLHQLMTGQMRLLADKDRPN